MKRLLVPLAKMRRAARVARYLANEPCPRLHVGCGSNILPGWLNTDLSVSSRPRTYLDATETLPFPDDSLSFIFTEHFISALSLGQAVRFLAECSRVLKPGGVLRTAAAGLPTVARVLTCNDEATRQYTCWMTREFRGSEEYSPCLAVNQFLYGFNWKFVYDPAFLAGLLRNAGFSEIQEASIGESRHPQLRGIEGHGKLVPPHVNELETFVLEATKPPGLP